MNKEYVNEDFVNLENENFTILNHIRTGLLKEILNLSLQTFYLFVTTH